MVCLTLILPPQSTSDNAKTLHHLREPDAAARRVATHEKSFAYYDDALLRVTYREKISQTFSTHRHKKISLVQQFAARLLG